MKLYRTPAARGRMYAEGERRKMLVLRRTPQSSLGCTTMATPPDDSDSSSPPMRIALLAPLLATMSLACRASDDASHAADSVRATTPPALAGACSAMSRVSRGTLRIVVGRNRAPSFPAPEQTPGTWQGCRLVGNAGARADAAASAPDAQLRAALTAEGWTPEPRFETTGAGVTQFGVRRAGALCVVKTTWPSGAQAGAPATTSAAGAPYRVDIRCTESSAVRG
jgi:hypothetical protein